MTKTFVKHRRMLLAKSALAVCLMTVAISSAAAQAVYEFNVPRGNLASVVTAIARASGTTIAFPAGLADGVVAGPIQGREPVRTALEQALAGSGLEIVESAGGNLTVRKASSGAGPQTGDLQGDVEAIDVTDTGGGSTYGDQGFKAGDAGQTVRLGDAPIKEIPIAVTAVTNDAIRSQGLTTATDAVRNVAGVTQTRNAARGRPQFSIRGFRESGYRVDGVVAGPEARVPIDNVDRVEVLKGPTSILTGVATEGGLVNVVRKRPTGEPLAEITTRLGEHFYKTVAIDVGGMVPDSDELAYRFVGSANHANESESGYANPNELLFAPSLKYSTDGFDMTTALEYTKQRQGAVPYAVLNAYDDENGLPAVELRRMPSSVFGNEDFGERNKNLSLHNDFNVEVGSLGGVDISFNNAFDYSNAKTTVNDVGLMFLPPPMPEVAYTTTFYSTDTDSLANRPSVTLKGELGGITSTTKLGYDYQSVKGSSRSGEQDASTNPLVTLPFFDRLDFYDGPIEERASTTKQSGVYAVQKLDLFSDRLHLFGSIRNDEQTTETAASADTFKASGDSFVLGAALDVTEDLSAYVNYSDGLVPGSVYFNRPMQPEGRTLKEGGLRYSMFDDGFVVSASLYELTRSNVTFIGFTGLINDPDAPFIVVDGLQTRGLELEAQGELSLGWKLIGNFTFLDAKNLSENTDALPYNPLAGNPDYSASLWTTYTFQDTALEGLTLGAGARGISDSDVNIGSDLTGQSYRLNGYVVADAMIGYEKNQFSADLKVNNIFDKEALQPAISGEYIGIERRSWLLSARYRF